MAKKKKRPCPCPSCLLDQFLHQVVMPELIASGKIDLTKGAVIVQVFASPCDEAIPESRVSSLDADKLILN